MPRLYNNQAEFNTLINSIRDQIYYNIPKDKQPTKDEFIAAFNKAVPTALVTKILNNIEDLLARQSNVR